MLPKLAFPNCVFGFANSGELNVLQTGTYDASMGRTGGCPFEAFALSISGTSSVTGHSW
jgi:hypothetical protein